MINLNFSICYDVETGLNKALYARLTKDQDAIANASGLGDLSDTAKGLIKQRFVHSVICGKIILAQIFDCVK